MLDHLLGLHAAANDLTFSQMGCRCLIVFAVGVVLIRVADRRFMARNAAFDVLLGIVLGSVLSRAINGQAAFFPTLGASAVLIVLHRLLGMLASRFRAIALLINDQPVVLVRDGRIDGEVLRRHNIDEDDLEENLRLNGNEAGVANILEARLERNGSISVVKKMATIPE
jgi:uncharacterized membrane protein YcaP (DUF421 family)